MNAELTPQEWQYVMAVLSKQPYDQVQSLMMKLQMQFQGQLAPVEDTEEQEEEVA